MENYRIFELSAYDERYLEPIKRLLCQLSSSQHHFGERELRAIVDAADTHLFLLECEERVCGMLTLAGYIAPTGRKQWIEDVVVDESMRGRSFGPYLVEYAIENAKQYGGSLLLTSRPSRVAANALYLSSGFEQRETNVYRIKF